MFRSTKDLFFYSLLSLLAVPSFLVLIFSIALLVKNSWSILSVKAFSEIFFSGVWDPYSDQFGFRDLILTSASLTILSLVLCIPASLFFCVGAKFYFPKRVSNFVNFLASLMLSIPSVIYGLWALMFLSPIFIHLEIPGMNFLLGILVLAAMLLPTMSSLLKSAFDQLDPQLVQSIEASGLSRDRMIWTLYIPSVKKNILSSSILAMLRALGETMAVMMVCGNIIQLPTKLLEPVRALTANIALEMGYALGTHRDALYLSGLCLLIVVVVLAILAQRLSGLRFLR